MTTDAYNKKHTTVAVDRETAAFLEQLIAQYKRDHPYRSNPTKAGIIRMLVAEAVSKGIGDVGPLVDAKPVKTPPIGRGW